MDIKSHLKELLALVSSFLCQLWTAFRKLFLSTALFLFNPILSVFIGPKQASLSSSANAEAAVLQTPTEFLTAVPETTQALTAASTTEPTTEQQTVQPQQPPCSFCSLTVLQPLLPDLEADSLPAPAIIEATAAEPHEQTVSSLKNWAFKAIEFCLASAAISVQYLQSKIDLPPILHALLLFVSFTIVIVFASEFIISRHPTAARWLRYFGVLSAAIALSLATIVPLPLPLKFTVSVFYGLLSLVALLHTLNLY